MLLATFVFPAFSVPYAVMIFQPIAVFLAMVAEILVFRLAYRSRLGWGRVVFLTVFADLVTWFAGSFVSLLLPTGLMPNVPGGDTLGHASSLVTAGPHYETFVVVSYVTAFFLSLVLDLGIWRGMTRKDALPRLSAVVVLANVVNYAAFFALAWLFSRLGWA